MSGLFTIREIHQDGETIWVRFTSSDCNAGWGVWRGQFEPTVGYMDSFELELGEASPSFKREPTDVRIPRISHGSPEQGPRSVTIIAMVEGIEPCNANLRCGTMLISTEGWADCTIGDWVRIETSALGLWPENV